MAARAAEPPRIDCAAIRTVTEWREAWQRLRVAARALDFDCRRELTAPRAAPGPAEAKELKAELDRVAAQHTVWQQDLWGGVARLRRRVLALGQALPHTRDAAEVKELVAGAERELVVLREQHRLEQDELFVQERTLDDTLNGLLVRFENWAAQPPLGKAALQAARARSTPRRGARKPKPRCNSVVDAGARLRARVEELAAEGDLDGGATGGWPAEEHETFLKLLRRRGRRKADEAFVLEAQALLPHCTHEQLVAHAQWLERHERRQDEQRRLLADWRERRASAAAAAAAAAEAAAAPTAELREALAERQARQELERRREEERARQKELVASWRDAQRSEQAAAAAAQREREAAERKRQESLRRQRRDAERRAIEAFRERRAAEEAAAQRSGRGASLPLSGEDRERIARRSSCLLQRALREKANRVQAERLRSLSCVEFEPPPRSSAYCHVPSRVYEDAAERAAERAELTACEEASVGSAASKYAKVHGNWAHQGIVRATRALPAWRSQYGV